MAEEKKAVSTEPKPRLKLTVKQIQKDLADGINRPGIAKKYGISAAEVARIFQHEKLKGLKVKTAPTVDLEDDTEDEPVKAKANKVKTEAATEPKAENVQGGPGEAVTSEKGVW